MTEMMENPTLIYEGPAMPWLDRPPAPLILIHDGGGTTYGYHCLYPIGRTLYGVHNPRLNDGGYWEGGIPVMASHYIELIEKVLPEGGEILLGGWSMGGLLSMEIAWQMANRPADSTRPKFKVLGMVFIDSVYSKVLVEPCTIANTSVERIVKTPEELAAMSLRDKVDLNMIHAGVMISRWQPPNWTGRELEIPPTVLMRAKKPVEHMLLRGEPFVDYTRVFHELGWDHYHDACFIKDVVEIDGDHFSIFESPYLKDVTAKVASAADDLDDGIF
ncbi:Alpha/Beta hydrolase protein [Xylaria sp. CBS 124048]|nr:Alpha/Beta hydrolase protein [Xylaria sp. CBS 124048]